MRPNKAETAATARHALGTGQTVGWCSSMSLAFIVVLYQFNSWGCWGGGGVVGVLLYKLDSVAYQKFYTKILLCGRGLQFVHTLSTVKFFWLNILKDWGWTLYEVPIKTAFLIPEGYDDCPIECVHCHAIKNQTKSHVQSQSQGKAPEIEVEPCSG